MQSSSANVKNIFDLMICNFSFYSILRCFSKVELDCPDLHNHFPSLIHVRQFAGVLPRQETRGTTRSDNKSQLSQDPFVFLIIQFIPHFK